MSSTENVRLAEGDVEVPAPEVALPKSRARLLDRLIGSLAYGRLRVVLPSGASFTRSGPAEGPDATIVLRNWRALRRVVFGGDIGFAEGFIEGDWTSPDRVALIQLLARNVDHLTAAYRGSLMVRAFSRLRHWMRPNSKRGSRKNIEAHYDLGNDFYKLWLDSSMLYSSAIFTEDATTLEAAQAEKLRRIETLLALQGGERVLEIGCGWGALAAHLAAQAQASMTAITLSPSQLSYASQIVADEQLSDRVDLRLQDYRDISESYDRVVSIEMFEAVGEEYWPSYFSTIANALERGGRAVLQVISIAEDRYENYKRDTDFIQSHIFPGGFLPSKTAFAEAVEKAGLRVVSTEFFGLSYAATLAEWRRRFNQNWTKVSALGFEERFRRLWNYYLEYCEAGFREGAIDVGLYTLTHAEPVAP
jgi:cyclopropane-fatty-acyl-phospholipid synthase